MHLSWEITGAGQSLGGEARAEGLEERHGRRVGSTYLVADDMCEVREMCRKRDESKGKSSSVEVVEYYYHH